jgi:hypothetical protein
MCSRLEVFKEASLQQMALATKLGKIGTLLLGTFTSLPTSLVNLSGVYATIPREFMT